MFTNFTAPTNPIYARKYDNDQALLVHHYGEKCLTAAKSVLNRANDRRIKSLTFWPLFNQLQVSVLKRLNKGRAETVNMFGHGGYHQN